MELLDHVERQAVLVLLTSAGEELFIELDFAGLSARHESFEIGHSGEVLIEECDVTTVVNVGILRIDECERVAVGGDADEGDLNRLRTELAGGLSRCALKCLHGRTSPRMEDGVDGRLLIVENSVRAARGFGSEVSQIVNQDDVLHGLVPQLNRRVGLSEDAASASGEDAIHALDSTVELRRVRR
jgi:hypothetical protein